MSEVEFIYNGSPTIIQCNPSDMMNDIYKKFREKIKINISVINLLKKMSSNIEIIFSHNQQNITIEVNLKEKLKDIIKKYINKACIQNVYFIYSGKQIIEENSVEQIINSDDKKSKKMRILVNDIERTTINERIVNSKEIICPICKESIKIRIKEYKINLYGCKNGHSNDNILLDEFESKQRINESEIKCGICNNDKSRIYKNIFYRCNKCEINICPICKSIHDKKHNIINYEDKNYICGIHNESYILYCETCKRNICMECENMHKEHKKKNYGELIPKKEDIEERRNEIRRIINKMKEDINEIIKRLNKVMENMEEYMNINIKIIKNIEEKNINYEILNNMMEIMNNNEIMEDMNKIINEKDINNKFKEIMKIYNKMNKKDGNNIDNNVNNNEKNKE